MIYSLSRTITSCSGRGWSGKCAVGLIGACRLVQYCMRIKAFTCIALCLMTDITSLKKQQYFCHISLQALVLDQRKVQEHITYM